MRILVIGGSGFIGRRVVERLLRTGHAVTVFHRGSRAESLPPGAASLVGDRRDLGAHRAAITKLAPDVVIDMILSSGVQARALVDACRGLTRRVVVASSMDVYRAAGVLHRLEPGLPELQPLTEESPLRTVARPYPVESLRMLQRTFAWLDDEYDKVAVEREVRGVPDLPATILRLPMVYGPGDPLHRFFPMLKRMWDRRPVIPFDERVARWSGSHGYVENVAQAIALAATAERAAGRVYNVAEFGARTELEWARLLAIAMRWRGRFELLPGERAPAHLRQPGLNLEQHFIANTARIRAELGYAEEVSLADGIRKTVEWERAHPPAEVDAAQFDYAAEDAALG